MKKTVIIFLLFTAVILLGGFWANFKIDQVKIKQFE